MMARRTYHGFACARMPVEHPSGNELPLDVPESFNDRIDTQPVMMWGPIRAERTGGDNVTFDRFILKQKTEVHELSNVATFAKSTRTSKSFPASAGSEQEQQPDLQRLRSSLEVAEDLRPRLRGDGESMLMPVYAETLQRHPPME
ncbi:MAG: hypothetical protein R3B91_01640 [Planctomycetaceae bacterium]